MVTSLINKAAPDMNTQNTSSPRQRITELRNRITELEAEKAAVKSAWLARDHVYTRACAAIGAAAERFEYRLNGELAASARPQPSAFTLIPPNSGISEVNDLLCFLFQDEIRNRIADQLNSMQWRGDISEETARAERLKSLELALIEAHLELDDLRAAIEDYHK